MFFSRPVAAAARSWVCAQPPLPVAYLFSLCPAAAAAVARSWVPAARGQGGKALWPTKVESRPSLERRLQSGPLSLVAFAGEVSVVDLPLVECKTNKTTKLARKKKRRRYGERVDMRYRTGA